MRLGGSRSVTHFSPADSSTLFSSRTSIVFRSSRKVEIFASLFACVQLRLSMIIEDRVSGISTFSHYLVSGDDAFYIFVIVARAPLSRTTFATLLQFAIELLLLRALQWLVGNTITSLPLQISFSSTFWREAWYSGIFRLKSELREGERKIFVLVGMVRYWFHFGLIVTTKDKRGNWLSFSRSRLLALLFTLNPTIRITYIYIYMSSQRTRL